MEKGGKPDELKRTEIADRINAKLLDGVARQGREAAAKSVVAGAIFGALVSYGSGWKPLTIGVVTGFCAMVAAMIVEASN